MNGFLYWAPRILAIVFTVFLSVFALDVFSEPQWMMGLIVHLIPSFILCLLTAVAWKHEKWGGALFILFGLAVIIFFHSITLSVPPFIIGGLFLARHHHPKTYSV